MNVLTRRSSAGQLQCVMHFGLGMVGAAIAAALQRRNYQISARLPFDWLNPTARRDCYQKLEALINSGMHGEASALRLSVIWSAGAANFYSSRQEVALERQLFQENLDCFDVCRRSGAISAFDYHLVSSAGGLFEGQQYINDLSKPCPRRPYGDWKLAQETILLDLCPSGESNIYRPSSVYGPSARRKRQGLINMLIHNTLNRQETVLDAHTMALRDYVLAADIGAFVSRRIARPNRSRENRTNFLVTGRSASIFEVVRKIRQVLHIHPRFRLDQDFGNHRHITFSRRILPPGWNPSTLEAGIRQFLLVSSGLDRPAIQQMH